MARGRRPGWIAVLALGGLALTSLWCKKGPAPIHQGAGAGAASRCFSPESLRVSQGTLVYSDVDTARVTGDVSGMELTLRFRDSSWTGVARLAEGQLGVEQPVRELRLQPPSGAIEFSIVSGSETSSFSGQFSCDSVWGTWRQMPAVEEPGRRLLRSRCLSCKAANPPGVGGLTLQEASQLVSRFIAADTSGDADTGQSLVFPYADPGVPYCELGFNGYEIAAGAQIISRAKLGRDSAMVVAKYRLLGSGWSEDANQVGPCQQRVNHMSTSPRNGRSHLLR